MKAFVVEHYGKDGLRAADVPEPEVGDGDVRETSSLQRADRSAAPLLPSDENGHEQQGAALQGTRKRKRQA